MKKIYLPVVMLFLGYFLGWFLNQNGTMVLSENYWNDGPGYFSVNSSGWLFFEDESRTIKNKAIGTRIKIVYNSLTDENSIFLMESLQENETNTSPILSKMQIIEKQSNKIVAKDDKYKVTLTPSKTIIEDKNGKMYLDKHFIKF